MKQLIIMRHGQAESVGMSVRDYDRHLTQKGSKDAQAMGLYIKEQLQQAVDLILTSSAIRTVETSKLISSKLKYSRANTVQLDELYLAPAAVIMESIQETSDDITTLLYIGHNPGVTDFIRFLGVRIDYLPTSSAVCFSFNCNTWSTIAEVNAHFEWFKHAKEL